MILFKNRFEGQPVSKPHCDCFDLYGPYKSKNNKAELKVHADTQDRECKAWRDLLHLIDEAAMDKREVFEPAKELGVENWKRIETLPREISKLKHVKHLQLYSSHLTWIPPEIGEMESLEEFTPYTSYKLHWFPYEITRCKKLVKRGNPVKLYGDDAKCSICGKTDNERGLNQVWISLRVATDVLPLLAHTCSKQCFEQLPTPAEGYVQRAHKGGLGLAQPKRSYI
jgi:hypothetical protein